MDLEAGRRRSGYEDIFISYHAKDDVQSTYAGGLFHNNRNYYLSPFKNNVSFLPHPFIMFSRGGNFNPFVWKRVNLGCILLVSYGSNIKKYLKMKQLKWAKMSCTG